MGKSEKSEPVTPELRRRGNSCRHSIGHLREELSPQVVGVSHESLGVGVFSGEVVGEIGVVSVGHPTVGVVPRHPVSGGSGRHFLRRGWSLWLRQASAFAEKRRRRWWEEEAKRQQKGCRFSGRRVWEKAGAKSHGWICWIVAASELKVEWQDWKWKPG